MVYYVTYGNTNIVMPFPVPQLLNVNVFDLGSNSLTFSQASLDFIMTFSQKQTKFLECIYHII